MTNTLTLRFTASCPDCGFASKDIALLNGHSCDTQANGGRCEDYPACGHEAGDCQGLLYGSDESIKAQVYRDIANGHGSCNHAEGWYDCEDRLDDYDDAEDIDHD